MSHISHNEIIKTNGNHCMIGSWIETPTQGDSSHSWPLLQPVSLECGSTVCMCAREKPMVNFQLLQVAFGCGIQLN